MIVRNFLFHRVTDEKDEQWPPMKPTLFEKIIKTLMRSYQVVCLEEWLQEGSGVNGKKPATVLFDDGYKDNIEYAAPILKKYKCPASFYVVTDSINHNVPTWTYLLDNAFQQTKIPQVKIDHPSVPNGLDHVAISDAENIRRIKPWMKQLANDERVAILNAILQQCNDVPMPDGKMMNWGEVNQLAQAGFHIGSHSHTHPMLAALEDEAEITKELTLSAETIKEKLGLSPITISYPIGSVDQRVIRLSQEAGYKYGLAVEQRFYKTEQDDPMAIPRVELYQEPWWKVSARVNGVYQKVKQLWQ